MRTLNFPRPPVSFLWLLPAIGLGLIAGLLPPLPALVLIGGMGLLIVTLIDPRIGLTVTLIVAPLKTLIETEAALKLPLDVGQIALLITLAAWLMRSIADQRRIGLRWSGVYLPLCAFLFAAALSLWGAVSPSATVNELIKWVEILLVMALVGSSGGGGGWRGRCSSPHQGRRCSAFTNFAVGRVRRICGFWNFATFAPLERSGSQTPLVHSWG
ncbi:MAG TPA: hypothetical protein PLD47_07280 [Aggregatilineales bacterium]|nr:hypothetical protein [Aggregatilineales bacterium]